MKDISTCFRGCSFGAASVPKIGLGCPSECMQCIGSHEALCSVLKASMPRSFLRLSSLGFREEKLQVGLHAWPCKAWAGLFLIEDSSTSE